MNCLKITPYLSELISESSSELCQHFASTDIPTEILQANLLALARVTCLAHLILDLITLIVHNREDLFFLSFPVTQQPKSGTGRLILEVYRSHPDTPHSVELLWTSDQSVAEICTWQHTNTHKRQTSMPPAVFEPTIPARARPNARA
jgi:hypothetical protein